MKQKIILKVIIQIIFFFNFFLKFLAAPEEAVLGTTTVNFNDTRFRRVVVTYVTTDLKIYVQYSEQGPKVEQLQSEIREIFNQTKPVGGHTPKKGELLAARFTVDNEWYRARVEKIEGNNRISVYFVDYGNREIITDLSRLTTLPPGMDFFHKIRYKYMSILIGIFFLCSRFFTITSSSS